MILYLGMWLFGSRKIVQSNSPVVCAGSGFTSTTDMPLCFSIQRICISEDHVSSYSCFFHCLISLVLGLARSRVNIAPAQFCSDMDGSNVCSLGEGWDHGHDRPQATQGPCSVLIWQGFCYQVRATVATWYGALAWSEPTWLIQMHSGIFWWVPFARGGAVLIIIIGCCEFQYLSFFSVITLTKSMCTGYFERNGDTRSNLV